jgi:hypothetical protein
LECVRAAEGLRDPGERNKLLGIAGFTCRWPTASLNATSVAPVTDKPTPSTIPKTRKVSPYV